VVRLRPDEVVKIAPAIRDAKGRFRNHDGRPAGQPLTRVVRMLWEGKGAPWPQGLTNPPQRQPPTHVPEGHAAFTFISHASFLIRLADGTTI